MLKYNTKSCLELENLILQFLQENPRSSIEEISQAIGYAYIAVYRLIEGRPESRSIVGLVNSGRVKAVPGINTDNNRLCWLYEVA